MRLLLIHAEEIWYKTHKPAVRNPPDPPGEYMDENAVVAFISIEKGDDEETIRKAVNEIYKYAVETVKSDAIILYPYAHLSSNLEKPSRAHYLTTLLEAELKKRWVKKLHRAPFGWYKEFKIHAKGHPLSELSRSITPGKLSLWFLADNKRYGLDEAVEKGIAPSCIKESSIELNKIGREKLELFGLQDWDGWLANEMAYRLLRRLASLYGPPIKVSTTPYVDAKSMLRLEAVMELYKSSTNAPAPSLTGSPIPSSIYKFQNRLTEFLVELNSWFSEKIERIQLCGKEPCLNAGVEGYLILYRGERGCLPLGVEGGNESVIGPLGNIVISLIDVESRKAELDEHVPQLPVWMHPITVYMVPVGEVAEYVQTVARELASSGAGVLVDNSMKGVGGRVRRAGKLWVPYTVTVGKREVETGTVTVRRRWSPGTQEVVSLSELVAEVRGVLSTYGVSGFIHYLS